MTNTTAPQLGRPVNPNSARHSGIELKRGRPVNPNSARQARLAKKVVSE